MVLSRYPVDVSVVKIVNIIISLVVTRSANGSTISLFVLSAFIMIFLI